MNCDVTPDSAPTDRRAVVIGFGSPIRGDDAVGPLAADQLSDRLNGPRVDVISRHLLTAELSEALRHATLVIFLDASAAGTPGHVHMQTLDPDRANAATMAHSLNPRGLLALTAALYGRAPDAVLISTPGQSFDYASYCLTPEVAQAVPEMIDLVLAHVAHHLGS